MQVILENLQESREIAEQLKDDSINWGAITTTIVESLAGVLIGALLTPIFTRVGSDMLREYEKRRAMSQSVQVIDGKKR